MCEVVGDRCGMDCVEDRLLRLGNRTKMVTDDIKITAQPALAAGELAIKLCNAKCEDSKQTTNLNLTVE